MNTKLLPLLLLATALAVPGAQAQGQGFSISMADEAIVITPGATQSLDIQVTIGCLEFASGGEQSYDVAITTDLPAGWGATSEGVTLAPGASCLSPAGTVSGTAVLKIKPTDAISAYTPTTFKVTATAGDLSHEFEHKESLEVGYRAGHTMTTSAAFPYNSTDGLGFDFLVNLTITANGDTMVMFEQVGAANGTVSGLFHQTFTNLAAESTRSLNVSWTPPTGAWSEDVISFYSYSHCLKGPSAVCVDTNGQNYTWIITNGAPVKSSSSSDEKAPGLPVIGLLAAIAVVAALRRQ